MSAPVQQSQAIPTPSSPVPPPQPFRFTDWASI
jgi:hypothetical protein